MGTIRKRIYMLFIGNLCLILSAYSQMNQRSALSVGDVLTDFTFENVLNYNKSNIRISELRGKLVILDMWSTTCSSCIEAFPKMEALQKHFGEKIQILLVNPYNTKYESKNRIIELLGKLKLRTGYYPQLPIPIQDTILNILFPHQSVPHVVWIDKDGKIIAITDSRDVNRENINTALEDKLLSLPLKNDKAFNNQLPLLIRNNGGNEDKYLYRTLFTKYIGGVGFSSGTRYDSVGNVIGVYSLNKSLKYFVSSAYADILNGFNESTLIYDLSNKAGFKMDFDTAYAYCYDLIVPPTPMKLFNEQEYLRQDLKRNFNLKANKELRHIKSYVFSSGGHLKLNLTKHKQTTADIRKSSIEKYFYRYSVKQLLNEISDLHGVPFIDETNFEQLIDIHFPAKFNLYSLPEVLLFFKNLRFNIKEEEREMEVVVITDK
jgi:thiol-disulfide isomerase/thioredoxin